MVSNTVSGIVKPKNHASWAIPIPAVIQVFRDTAIGPTSIGMVDSAIDVDFVGSMTDDYSEAAVGFAFDHNHEGQRWLTPVQAAANDGVAQ